ncbi:MAG: 2-isopropylmalate synthase [Gammaproteobacteria bacterium]|nr:2-isopropylmalate synthase [Gammaproteobacteria bacterium]
MQKYKPTIAQQSHYNFHHERSRLLNRAAVYICDRPRETLVSNFDHRKYRPYPTVKKTDRRWPDAEITQAPAWCSVDLRDGNQALIKPMSVAQKLKLFKLLVQIGFKEIEVGFPAASQPDFDFVRAIIDQGLIPDDVTIQVLVQAREELIACTFESLEGVKQAIVHVYNSTSTVQRKEVFGLDREGVKQIAVRGATWVRDYAAKHPNSDWTFQYSPESFTGTEIDYAVEVIDAVTNVWQPQNGQKMIVNLPATVEMSTPNVFADMVESVLDQIKHRQHITVSLHTHNDRGCAVAASELGIMAGADRIEGTLFGNGERTGNMDIVTMAMNLYSQGVDPKLDLSNIQHIVDVCEDVTEIALNPRHPYAGELVYAAFSGSHQDAIRKCLSFYQPEEGWHVAYLPIDPQDVNRTYEAVVRINSQSGKGGVTHVLERDYGITMPRWLQTEFAKTVQREAEVDGGEINGMRIRRLFDTEYLNTPDNWNINAFDLHTGESGAKAKVTFGSEAQRTEIEGVGNGAIDATASALQNHLNVEITVESFDEFSLGGDSQANAMACIAITFNGHKQSAVALGSDTTSVAVQALLNAVGRAVNNTRLTKSA